MNLIVLPPSRPLPGEIAFSMSKRRTFAAMLGVAAAITAGTPIPGNQPSKDPSKVSVETTQPQSQKPSPVNNDPAPAQEPRQGSSRQGSYPGTDFFPELGNRGRFRGFSGYGRGRYYRPTKGKPTTNKLKRSHRTRRSHRRSKR